MIHLIPPARGTDAQGSGHFRAPRKYGEHHGIDLACIEGSMILSPHAGEVTKIGDPYPPGDERKGHLRYVQVTEHGKYRCRYFYIYPTVSLGADIRPGDVLGISQDLTNIYPGITNHLHFEVIEGESDYLDPVKYLGGNI